MKNKKKAIKKVIKMSGSNLIFRTLVYDLTKTLANQASMSKKEIIEQIDSYLCELKLMVKPAMKRELNRLYKTGTKVANT